LPKSGEKSFRELAIERITTGMSIAALAERHNLTQQSPPRH
jgi:hypothetical protein